MTEADSEYRDMCEQQLLRWRQEDEGDCNE